MSKTGGRVKSDDFGSKVRKVKKVVFLVKKGVKKSILGGGRKTHPLKVDRIYGETFSVVITGGGHFFVIFGVKNTKFVTFLDFSTFSTF